jgi:hypothetical protein
VEEKAQEKV